MFITNSPQTKFTLNKKGISTIWPTLLKLQCPPHVYVINLHWTRKESVSYLSIRCCTSSKNRSMHIPNKQTSQHGMISDPNPLDQKIKTARPFSRTQKRGFSRNNQKRSYNDSKCCPIKLGRLDFGHAKFQTYQQHRMTSTWTWYWLPTKTWGRIN